MTETTLPELRSFPSLEKRFWLLTLLSSIGAYVCLIVAVDFMAKVWEYEVNKGIYVGVYGGLIAAVVAGAARLCYVPRAFLKLRLKADGLTFDRDGRLFEVPFAQIESMSARAWPAFASRLRVQLSDRRVINLSFALAGLDRAVEAIFAARPELRSEPLLRKAMRTSRRSARAYDLPDSWLTFFVVKYAVFPFGVGVLGFNLLKCLIEHDFTILSAMYTNGQRYVIIPTIVVTLPAWFSGFCFTIAREIFISLRESRTGQRDLAFENALRFWFNALYFGGWLLLYTFYFYRLMTPTTPVSL